MNRQATIFNDSLIIPNPQAGGYSRPRDHRLDFWRGLCLIDMLLVHLIYENVQFGDFLKAWLGSYTRFAAGGYIFISGLGIGAIFLPRVIKAASRKTTYLSLWRRSFFVLGVQYISALGFVVLDLSRGVRPWPGNAWVILRDILLLREGGDLLPFYVIMLALSPFLLELLRQRAGAMIALLLSLGLFTWGQWHPWAFALAAHDKFPPVLWQAVFIAGVVFGSVLPRYDAMGRGWKLLGILVAWVGFGLLFVSEYSSDFGLPGLNLGVGFAKVPLSVGEALRYLTLVLGIFLTIDQLWPLLAGRIPVRFVETLGRKSLPVYVAHVWLVEGVAALAVAHWWWGRWQILLGVASVVILWVLAVTLEAIKSRSLRSGGSKAWVIRPGARSEAMPV